jgi:dethiobiotin synthetase
MSTACFVTGTDTPGFRQRVGKTSIAAARQTAGQEGLR